MGRICRANERRQQRGSEVTGDDGNKKRAGRQRPRGRSTSADKEANDMSETHQKKAKGARGGRAAGVKLLLLYTGVAGILWLTVTRHAGPASGESLNAVAGSKRTQPTRSLYRGDLQYSQRQVRMGEGI